MFGDSQAEIVHGTGLMSLLPFIIGLTLTIPIYLFLVPRSLRGLQVAFPTGERVYEVHLLTESVDDAKELLRDGANSLGTLLYLMAVCGVLTLAADITLSPFEYETRTLQILAVLLGVPIFLSPISSLSAQLAGSAGLRQRKSRRQAILRQVLHVMLLLGLLFGVARFVEFTTSRGWSASQVLAWSIILLLLPAIMAYGRILGSGWNALTSSKYHRARGRASILNPEAPTGFGQILAGAVFLNAVLMPLTAINGIVSFTLATQGDLGQLFVHSSIVQERLPQYTNATLMQEGGIFGFWVIEFAARIPGPDIFWARGVLAGLLVAYLILNVTIIGVAFVYEVARLMFLGVGKIGGTGSFAIAEPRALRAERSLQGQVLNFCFSGFAGYTVLLMTVTILSKFSGILPSVTSCTEVNSANPFSPSSGFCDSLSPLIFEELTWTLAVAGQTLFFIFWLISLPKFLELRKSTFDLDAGRLRNKHIGGSLLLQSVAKQHGNQDMIDLIANDDLGRARYEIGKVRQGEESPNARLRLARAEMMMAATQGMWVLAEERATSALAQAGGDDDVARKILAAAALAQRDADECLMDLENISESDVEAHILRWIAVLMEPELSEALDERTLIPIMATPAGRRNRDLVRRYAVWDPWPGDELYGDRPLDRRALLSDIAIMRLKGHSQEAYRMLSEILGPVERPILWPRGRVAEALLLLDLQRRGDVLKVYDTLLKDHPMHPCVLGLGAVLDKLKIRNISPHVRTQMMPEVFLSVKDPSRIEWDAMMLELPSNPVAALKAGRSGHDEVLAANAWLVSGNASSAAVHPNTQNFAGSWLIIAIAGILSATGLMFLRAYGLGLLLIAALVAIELLREARSRSRVFANAPILLSLAKRLRSAEAMPAIDDLPHGTHLLLSGFLAEIDGVPVDIGFPAWVDPHSLIHSEALPGVSLPAVGARKLRQLIHGVATSGQRVRKFERMKNEMRQRREDITTLRNTQAEKRPILRPEGNTSMSLSDRVGRHAGRSARGNLSGPKPSNQYL